VSRAPRRRSCKARDRAVLREYREGAERSRCGCIDVRMQAYLWNGVLREGGVRLSDEIRLTQYASGAG
ncbi:MAG: hypothetical protein KKF66_08090, partial [Actinobacteria bacterium]|nr:hypothetical protein [Actinomycetota bacterium]